MDRTFNRFLMITPWAFLLTVLFMTPAQAQRQSQPTATTSAQVQVNSQPAPTTSSQAIEDRLREMEKRLEEMELRSADSQMQDLEGRGRVRSFFSNPITFGGFFENAITAVDGPDTDAQVSANSHILGFNIAADLNQKIRFVSQFLTVLSYNFLNQHNNPAVTPPRRQFSGLTFGAIVAQGYAEYLHSTAFRVQTGLGYAPFGYALQQREIVLFKRRTGPQLVNALGAGSVGIAYPLWTGLHVLGSFPLQDNHWGYNLYSFTPLNNPKTLGLGSRLWWRDSQQTTIGVSTQTGHDIDNRFDAVGTDVSTKFDRFGVVAEYARTKVTGSETLSETYYLEPFVTFANDTVVFYVAADFLNNAAYGTIQSGSVVSDPYKRWDKGFGVNWLPVPYVRLRLGYLQHDYVGDTAVLNGQDRDAQTLDFSAGVTF